MTSELTTRFHKVIDDYEATFNDPIGYPIGLQIPVEEWIDQIQHCIDTKTPYEWPQVPEGCIA